MESMKSELNSSVSLYGLSDLSIAKSTENSISKVNSKKIPITKIFLFLHPRTMEAPRRLVGLEKKVII